MRPIIIAAGGTGGHLSPAEAVAAEFSARGERVILMTDARSMTATENFPCEERIILSGAGLAGRGIFRAAKGGAAMIAGVAQAARVMRAQKPAAVVGFGGYPSVAPVIAARLFMPGWPVPVILHEQNAVLGRANRLLSRGQATLALTYAGTTRIPVNAYTVVTGNPVRSAIAALSAQPYPDATGRLRLLVTGGSLGAGVFSRLIPAAVALLPTDILARLDLAQQVRPEDMDSVREHYQALGLTPELAPFFADMPQRLAGAHLVIARAGASTCAELACAGRPAILVPLPGAIDDHQSANAAALAVGGGAIVAAQGVLTPDALAAHLVALLGDPGRLAAMAAAEQAMGCPDAARLLADTVQTAVREEVG
ncbi:UDP-N-acetylglucosamine--N-acetylmuramyl-(pentapeptide) pyrophosphoryl-undecaprenol N-acetylglucosamine transferase [Humitalea sp. 24SJ18S-53]|uniref:UDP-N-acetylglucosamine--N-acetylmuramyl- (pentapeptide) pyrophosphoryl-undecaprenol N-acetylglucosamine transferase n=1 Tax=Humitalea sp. 24SJ18S-53 TaxID=3422307 RepID=UPI003D6679FC